MELLYKLHQNRLLYFFTFLFAFFILTKIVMMLPDRSIKNDFAHYYLASKFYLEEKNIYQFDLVTFYVQNNFTVETHKVPKLIAPYPPSFYAFFSPLAKLKSKQAFMLWLLLEVISLCTIFWLTKILLADRLSNKAWFYFCTASIGSAGVIGNFYYSQVSLLLAALVLSGYTLHRNGNYSSACIVISIAGIFKIFPFILLPWFLTKGKRYKWDQVFRAFFVLVFLIFIIVLTDTTYWIEFLKRSKNLVTADTMFYRANYNLPSFVIDIGYAWYNFKPPEFQARLWTDFGVMTGLILIGLCYFICFITDNDPEIEFCLICLAMLLGSTRTLGHYLVFLIFPIAVALVRSFYCSQSRFLIMIIIYIMLNLHMLGYIHDFFGCPIYIKIFVSFIPMYGMLGLMAFFLFAVAKK